MTPDRPAGTVAQAVSRPGTGWPGDPADPDTPVAGDALAVAALAHSALSVSELAARESVCRACPRLVEWREQVAAEKRRSYSAERYWGRPVPTWGAEDSRLLILGLAPAAHGGNRTGRIFTGDRSGDVLFAALYRAGFATKPTSVAADDGQRLIGARMTAAVRCAPPANKPTVTERDTCAPWLAAELAVLREDLRVILCLGHFAWQALWPQLSAAGVVVPRPRPVFGHGAEAVLGSDSRPLVVLGCYHPSQQNTFTGKVTDAMLDAVLVRAAELVRA